MLCLGRHSGYGLERIVAYAAMVGGWFLAGWLVVADIRVLLSQPRRSALKMLIFGDSFANRVIREANGDDHWWTRLRYWLWNITRGKLPAGWWA